MTINTAGPSPSVATASHTDSEQDMLARERAALTSDHDRRAGANRGLWTGIALSGGGIRSATFALGAMQALARYGLLSRFDYVSSVSGGSYLACSLQWWWASRSATQFGTSRVDFPYGLGTLTAAELPADTDAQRKNLAYLSHHAHYLDPGNGLSILAGVGIVLRTVFVSLLVWVPLCVLLFILSFVLDQFIVSLFGAEIEALPIVPALDALARWTDGRGGCWMEVVQMDCGLNLRLTYALAVALLPAWLCCFALSAVLLGLLSRTSDRAAHPTRLLPTALQVTCIAALAYAEVVLLRLPKTLEVVTFLLLFVLSTLWIAADLLAPAIGDQSYRVRRWLQQAFARSCVPVVAIALVGAVPILDKTLFDYFAELSKHEGVNDIANHRNTFANIAGIVSLLSGVSTSLYGYYSLTRKISPSLSATIFSSIGAFLFIYGILIFSHMLATLVYEAMYSNESTLIDNLSVILGFNHNIGATIVICSIATSLVALFLAVTININHMGLHRFYRDRLMESFMPSTEAVATNSNLEAVAADRFLVTDQPSPSTSLHAGGPLPFLLVNTIAILTGEADQTIAMRGGENFAISPLFVGCGATGWADTSEYIRVNGPLTLASAMAASGAAVNADSGYVGSGITRGRMLSSAMSILNMRLGIWIANPRPRRWFFNRIPTYVRPMLWQGLLGFGHKRDSAFLELADGGHFDNLGLYELVRRKLGLILVIDGEADSTLAMPGLVSVLRRIEEDFRARVEFTPGLGVERFVGNNLADFFPKAAKPAKSAFLTARIHYEGGATPGTLIYVKLAGLKDLDFTTLGYWAANDVFPYESTANQFFTVAQFEAYRNLGHAAVKEMAEALELVANFDQPSSIQQAYTKRNDTKQFDS